MIIIDKNSHIPIYEQIVTRIERLIERGVLGSGDKIPAVRTLAQELTVNPNTVQKAYTDLESAGITESVHGVGRFVSQNAVNIITARRNERRQRLYDTLKRFYELGIDRGEILDIVKEIYEG